MSRPCDACAGTGEIVSARCTDCRGQGRVEGQQTLKVRIPRRRRRRHAAAPDGRGRGRHRGRPARRPLRRDRDAASTRCSSARARISTARCRSRSRRPRSAREVDVPTLEGRVKLEIPEGTQSGQGDAAARARVCRRCARARAAISSLRIFVEVPSELTDAQRELLEEFAEESGDEGVARAQGLPRQAARPVRLSAAARGRVRAASAFARSCARPSVVREQDAAARTRARAGRLVAVERARWLAQRRPSRARSGRPMPPPRRRAQGSGQGARGL